MKYYFKKAITAFVLAGAMLFNSLPAFAASSSTAGRFLQRSYSKK